MLFDGMKHSILKPIVVLMIASILFVPQMSLFAEVTAFAGGQSGGTVELPQEMPSVRGDFVPGDGLQVEVFPDTTLFISGVYPIDDEGFVVLPVLGKVYVSGMEIEEFEAFLKEKYSDFLKWPYINVRPLIRASILGGVIRPGLYYVEKRNSLWDLVRLAGGTISEDGLKEMHWKRDGKIVKENIFSYYQSGMSFEKMGFKSGDQIWVKTPNKPGWLEKIARILPVFTFVVTSVNTYFLIKERTK